MINKFIKHIIFNEDKQLNNYVNLIASENKPSKAIHKILGSCLQDRYTEGYPGHRHYAGCEIIDKSEQFAIDQACKLFKCNFANVQPWSGSQANAAVFNALLKPGEKVMSLSLSEGAHLSHGSKFTFSGKYFKHVEYKLDNKGFIDYKDFERVLNTEKPELVIAGCSAYSREINFKKLREIIAKYKRKNNLLAYPYFMVDMAHIAGLVASGVHQSPIPYADVITSTTHKTLRGPRGGLILWNNEKLSKKINSSVFPGIQGGANQASIAAKAQCFIEAQSPKFKKYCEQILKNIKALQKGIEDSNKNLTFLTGGSDNHMLLIDVSKVMNGQEAEDILYKNKIICNKNMIKGDEKPSDSSGIRLGSAFMTSRGWKEKQFYNLGIKIGKLLTKVEI